MAFYEQQVEQNTADIARIEKLLEDYYWQFHLHMVNTPTLLEAIERTIMKVYEIPPRDIMGQDRPKKGRPNTKYILKNKHLDISRFWLTCLLIQCAGKTYDSVRSPNYFWMTRRRYDDAAEMIQEMFNTENNEHRQQWKKLLDEVRKIALELGVDTERIDDELKYA